MAFWTAILVGALFVWLTVRLGFYETWGLLFSCIVSIYVAVFLAPSVAGFASATAKVSAYSTALAMVALAGGCFAILYGLSYVFLTGQFKISFPEIFDILLAGAMGFLTGFLVLSFVALALTTTPLAENELAHDLGLNPESEKSNIACIAWCCDRVHSVVGGDTDDSATRAAIGRLLNDPPSPEPDRQPGADETDEPAVSQELPTPL